MKQYIRAVLAICLLPEPLGADAFFYALMRTVVSYLHKTTTLTPYKAVSMGNIKYCSSLCCTGKEGRIIIL